MTFTRPVTGPKVYVARGPSGHPETFRREDADQALRLFLGAVPTTIAIEGFLRKLQLEGRLEGWADVVEYLGAFTQIAPDRVPLDVAVAFWAQVTQVQEANKRAKEAKETN